MTLDFETKKKNHSFFFLHLQLRNKPKKTAAAINQLKKKKNGKKNVN